MKKCISLCLYGNDRKYVAGAVGNINWLPEIYPGWDIHVNYDQSVSPKILDYLDTHGAHMYDRSRLDWQGSFRMLWRWLVLDPLYGYDVMLSRDVDSRPSRREAQAVAEWLQSGELAHNISDSTSHDAKIMGGLSGLYCHYPNVLSWIEHFRTYVDRPQFGFDQTWLALYIHPLVSDSLMHHGTYGTYPLTIPIAEGEFHCGAADGPREEELLKWGVADLWNACT